jgi:hypothetical protein
MDKFLPYFVEMIAYIEDLAAKKITEEEYNILSSESLKKFSKTWELKDMREIKKMGEIAGISDTGFKTIFEKIYLERLAELIG